jgi:hypothetical protein
VILIVVSEYSVQAALSKEEEDEHSLCDEITVVSPIFKFIMNTQLALILFLAFCMLYDHVGHG